MKKFAGIILLAAVMASSGCTMRLGPTTSTVPLATYSARPPQDPEQVKVYLSEQDVPGTFEKLALIYAEEGWLDMSVGRLIRRMKAKAAGIGANGMILGNLDRKLAIDGADVDSVDIAEKKLITAVAIYIPR